MTPTTTHSRSMAMVVVVIAAVLVVQCLLLPVAGDEQLVRATCSKTGNPNVCMSILSANSSSLTTDLFGLTTISGEALLTNFTLLSAYAQQIASDMPPSFLRNIVMKCVDSYKDGFPELHKALDALAARRLGVAEALFMTRSQLAPGCRKTITDYALYEIRWREEAVMEIAHVTIDMIHMLQSA